LKYLADSESAGSFAAANDDTEHLLVPVITIYGFF
jgi:hypothetical protein